MKRKYFIEEIIGRSTDNNKAYYKFIYENSETILSFNELRKKASKIAAFLNNYYSKGDCVLISVDFGIDYILALFGCLFSGLIAVPLYPENNLQFSKTVGRICKETNAQCILLSQKTANLGLSIDSLTIKDILESKINTNSNSSGIEIDSPAILLYTSGSTGNPKGVMLSYANIRKCLIGLSIVYEKELCTSFACWLPPNHMAGLFYGLLLPFYYNRKCVLTTPQFFTNNPKVWLKCISQEKISFTLMPNSAYDMLVNCITESELTELKLDFSCWNIAINASELVLEKTIDLFCNKFQKYGFKKTAIIPHYGMTEGGAIGCAAITTNSVGEEYSKLVVNKNYLIDGNIVLADESVKQENRKIYISVGNVFPGYELAIISNDGIKLCEPGKIGEIWVHGSNYNISGYWNKPKETKETFFSSIGNDFSDKKYLRTGDLGFLDEKERLYITGRLKEMIIINGLNVYPQDLENIITGASTILVPNACVAFCAEDREAYIAVSEVYHSDTGYDEIYEKVIENLLANNSVLPEQIILIPKGELPRTGSGKLRRNVTREKLYAAQLNILDQWSKGKAEYIAPRNKLEIELCNIFEQILKLNKISIVDNYIYLGMNSILSGQIVAIISKQFGRITLKELYDSRNIKNLIEKINTGDSTLYNEEEII